MKMDFVYKLLKEKHDVLEATIDGDENDFVIRCNDGQIFSHADFTKSELEQAKVKWEAEKAQKEADATAAKIAAKEKLSALGLTADDLKALGL
jgi:hypothetical protein